MKLRERIKAFKSLGEIIGICLEQDRSKPVILNGHDVSARLNELIINQEMLNPWFTPENVRSALKAIAGELTEKNLDEWINAYPELEEDTNPITAGIIMAGNIPLVGFHDFLSVLISGNKIKAKTSSKDSQLIVYLANILEYINEEFKNLIEFTDSHISDFDVIIATGSNNSSRYFEYYFGKYPNIIRKNRSSIAIIEGDEKEDDLLDLGTDIFSYFGLGCRNVSKIYLPAGYDISVFSDYWKKFEDVIRNVKYANNYDFNKAVYIVNKDKFLDTGYLLLKESNALSSPVSVLYYEFYESRTTLKNELELLKENIQCLVGREGIPYGKAQSPKLWDYADGIDTIEFLLKKKIAGIF